LEVRYQIANKARLIEARRSAANWLMGFGVFFWADLSDLSVGVAAFEFWCRGWWKLIFFIDFVIGYGSLAMGVTGFLFFVFFF
jgi:hypothetical protein